MNCLKLLSSWSNAQVCILSYQTCYIYLICWGGEEVIVSCGSDDAEITRQRISGKRCLPEHVPGRLIFMGLCDRMHFETTPEAHVCAE